MWPLLIDVIISQPLTLTLTVTTTNLISILTLTLILTPSTSIYPFTEWWSEKCPHNYSSSVHVFCLIKTEHIHVHSRSAAFNEQWETAESTGCHCWSAEVYTHNHIQAGCKGVFFLAVLWASGSSCAADQAIWFSLSCWSATDRATDSSLLLTDLQGTGLWTGLFFKDSAVTLCFYLTFLLLF